MTKIEIGTMWSALSHLSHWDRVEVFAARIAAAEQERIAQEFDRRAVYSDGTPSSGWYEPHEPAEIVRSMK